MQTLTIPEPNNEMIEVPYKSPVQIPENVVYSGSISPSGSITFLSIFET